MHVCELLILPVQSPDFFLVELFDSHEAILLLLYLDQLFLEHFNLLCENLILLNDELRVVL